MSVILASGLTCAQKKGVKDKNESEAPKTDRNVQNKWKAFEHVRVFVSATDRGFNCRGVQCISIYISLYIYILYILYYKLMKKTLLKVKQIC